MRFYCPKCDLKYRIDDDKLAEQPNAQLRCKACHTVFSVQAAIKQSNDRRADGRAPVDVAENLSLPPPKPAPLAWKSTAPPVSTPPGKGVVTMPLLDVTARPRIEPAKPVNASTAAMTKPGLAPSNRGVSIGPRAGQRTSGAASLLAAKGLRGAGERASLPQVKIAPQRSPQVESTRPVQVLGRGSAFGFPPVTEERTHPVVPPLPRAARDIGVERHFVSREPGPDVAIESERRSETPPPIQAPVDAEGPADGLDSELALIESEPPMTPVMGTEAYAELATHRVQWETEVSPPAEALESQPLALSRPVERPTVAMAEALHANELAAVEPPLEPSGLLRTSWGARPDLGQPEPEVQALAPKRGVSFGVAIAVALVCGIAGFGGGYLLGVKSEHVTARPEVAAPFLGETQRPSEPPPPPPPEDVAAGEEQTAPRPAMSGLTVANKLGAHGDIRSAESDNVLTPIVGASSLDGLRALVAGPSGVAAEGASAEAPQSGLDASAIQATVQRFQPAIRRTCWQPALSRRGGEAGSGARVTTTVMIAPTGRVTSVKHEGEPSGFPGLASCIAMRVQGWKFPRASTGTTAKIPFVFAAQ